MNYSEILKSAISNTQLSLSQICKQLNEFGPKIEKGYLSKLQNGKIPPAGDKLNEVLSVVLDIDPLELKTAAYREKIPADVLKNLLKINTA
jgi:transcriptional regulator with XRE-family HTH domain